MSKISTWSTTAANNNSAVPDGWAESMMPSGVNNSAREMMAQIRDEWNDKEWFLLGDGDGTTTFTYASATSVTIASDITSTYHVGRRVKVIGTNTSVTGIYGKIATSSYSSPNTTLTFTFDSGSISASDATVDVYAGSTYVAPSIPVIDEDTMSSNTAILPPSQQSVKAYVDTQVTAQDLDLITDSGNIDIDLDSESLTLTGGTGIDTSATGSTVTFAIDSTVVTESSTDTLTNKTISGSSNTLSNIANGSLSNSTVSYGGISLSLGGSDATPAFDLTDATSYPTSSLTGTISNSQVATGIDAAKLADGSVSDTEFQYINSLSSNAQTQISARLVAASDLSDVASASTSRTNLGLGTISTQASSNVSITGGSITGLGSPSAGSDATTKTYVDNLVTGLKTRIICRVATTANIDLTADLENGDTLDGITLATDDKVLVKNQTTTTANGIYKVVASGTASRDPDFDTVSELSGQLVIIQEGTSNEDTMWLCTTDDSGSIGSTTITFSQVFPSSGGTVTSVGLAQSGSEFTISGSPVTSSGNITVDVNRIAATKIGADTSVSNTEYGYLANVSSDIQTQLDTKATQGFCIAMSVAL